MYEDKCESVVSVTTTSLMDLCWPHYEDLSKTEKANWKIVTDYLHKNPVFLQLVNLTTAWRAILFSMASAFIFCIIYIYFMSIFAEYVAWGIIFLTQIGLLGLTIGSLYFYTTSSAESSNKNAALAVGIGAGIATLVFAIMLFCGWQSLKLAIEIVNCSADFLAATKRLLVVPVMYYIMLFLFFMFWLACIISVESMGRIEPAPGDGIVFIPLDKDIEWDDRKEQGKLVNWMLFYLSFGLIWFTFFLTASNNYVVMVTAATYYFSSDPNRAENKYGSGNMTAGLRWAWVHNFGSIAFGSLLIAIIFTIRLIAYYLCKKAEKASGDNAFIKCVSCMVQCFLKCLEEIMEYINRAAYAFMSITGQPFCKSAYNGICLQFKHGAKFAFGNMLAAGFIIIGKIGLTILNVCITWLFMKHVTGTATEVSNPYAPLAIVALTTYMIVAVFLGLFDEAVLAMMTSMTADMDINGGTPKWGPETLHKVLTDLDSDEDEGDKKEVNTKVNEVE